MIKKFSCGGNNLDDKYNKRNKIQNNRKNKSKAITYEKKLINF